MKIIRTYYTKQNCINILSKLRFIFLFKSGSHRKLAGRSELVPRALHGPDLDRDAGRKPDGPRSDDQARPLRDLDFRKTLQFSRM